ncbi:ribonucleotide-diphosphate reductase subunit RNR4 KNAG_0H02620 [Huiozyma naganishii CBS 8797]|uniref:Uncharacterized protein n=1 Tax=Huiozyma naganishii (strain ATCC MYA-139 / BCRC 22969 / CBS 8797 / KCTC 17520 / NBRC 10181 / NCYC 3082 / Yp74L-3) TaxID=1071383 RepID=J7S1V7_HUIN7|nr:hypothetical protein KNAG_0H02620 [Kazachstania naganishii CBS 8797]CCK71677.1 hypothetical protein KNAG_0H02620 [Kazachstania naganishii CBS 8797]
MSHAKFLSQFSASREATHETEKDEILLIENKRRFVMFPIKYHEIWAAYKKAEASFWTAEEIELSKDVEDIADKKVTAEQLAFLKKFMALLTLGEDIVNRHLIERFSAELQNPEGKSFYGFQIMMENIYDEVYSMVIDAYFNGPENIKCYEEIKNCSHFAQKTDFINRWIKDPESLYGERLVAFAAKEGIFLSGAHAAVFALGEKGLLAGLNKANTNIYRDKGSYTDFSCLLFAHLKKKPEPKVIEKIITEAVDIEKDVLVNGMNVKEAGVDEAQTIQYVEYLADSLLLSFGNEKVYNVSNPFEFMADTTSIGKSRFFEKQVSDFIKAKQPPQAVAASEAFNFNESF